MKAVPGIEHGIPIPPRYTSLYRWHEMGIGDSRLFTDRGRNAVKCLARSAVAQTGFKFTIRKVRGGFRIWRVE